MLTMLIVLGMIIAKASDPATWAWLVGDQAAMKQDDEADQPNGAVPPAVPVTAQTRPETVTEGPTDQDIEEADGAAEEFMALTDGGLGQSPEEMLAYWRLFGWVQHQSTEQLRQRASGKVVFNDFIRDPDASRGKLFRLNLNVRQIHEYPATKNRVGVSKVYEVRGFTDESKAWLYFVLVPELPQGMPTGTNVTEKVSFTGYFYKLQGYYEAGAGPRDSPLRAPLLIGRLTWKPSPHAAGAQSDFDWISRELGRPGSWVVRGIFIGGVLAIIALGFWMYGLINPRRAVEATATDFESTRKAVDVRHWLSDAEHESHAYDDRDQHGRPIRANGRPGPAPDFHNER
jgi:hypothetical protein